MSENEQSNTATPSQALLGFYLHVLGSLLQEYPQYVDEVPFAVFDEARQNDKRPAWIKAYTEDDVVKNMRGKEEEKDWFIMFRVKRPALEALKEKQESLIIKP